MLEISSPNIRHERQTADRTITPLRVKVWRVKVWRVKAADIVRSFVMTPTA